MPKKFKLSPLSLALLSGFVSNCVCAQPAPSCPTGSTPGITGACTVSSSFTYPTGAGPIYQYRTDGVTGILTIANGVVLTSNNSNTGTNVINIYSAAKLFNLTNNGTINGSGTSAVINSSSADLTTSIINSGNIYSANSSLEPFTPAVTPGTSTYAISLTSANKSFTLDNKAGAKIVGAVGGVVLNMAENSLFKITNAGLIQSATSNTNSSANSAIHIFTGATIAGLDKTSFITNEATGVIKGEFNGIRLGASYITTNPLNGITITNRGSIQGVEDAGIELRAGSQGVIISNYGTIAGGTSAVNIANGGGNTFNVHTGSAFTNGINFNNTTGNTVNFHTGSYTLGVKNYATGTNTIKLLGTGNQLITTGLDGGGTGNIVVVAPAPAAAAPVVVNNTAATVSNVVNSVASVASTLSGSSFRLLPPTQGVSPDVPGGAAPAGLGAQSYLREDRFRPAGGPGGAVLLASADSSAALELLSNRQAQRVDSQGNVAWARGFASAHKLPSTNQVVGHLNTSAGLMFGVDTSLENGRRAGVYGGYSQGYTHMNDASGKLVTNYYMGGAYLRGTAGNYNWMANLSGGLMANQMNRSINNGAEQAKASFDSIFVSPELALSRSVALSPVWNLTPTLRGRYVGVFMPRYTETGSSQNVSYAAKDAHSLEQRLELKLTRSGGGSAAPHRSLFYVQAAAIANQRIGDEGLNANVLGTDFVVRNPQKRNIEGLLVGFGLDHYELRKNVSAFGGLDISHFNDDSSTIIGRIGIRMAF